MENESNLIWNEYEGQEFKTGDCSPLSRSVKQRYLVWDKEGDWKESDKRIEPTLDDFENFVHWKYGLIERTKLGMKPKMTVDDIEMLVRLEKDNEVKKILTDLMDVICEWWNGCLEHDTEEEREYLVYWEDRIAETVFNLEESLLEVDSSHRYFKFDTDYLQGWIEFDDEGE